jgi:PTS system nitrogen regulatory IIA component
MELKMKDVMEILQTTEKEILKYVKEKGLPAHKINHQNMFSREELKEWVVKNGITVSEKILNMNLTERPVKISNLISHGGIIYGIHGRNAKELLSEAVSRMKLPAEVKREDVLTSLIEREEMMPTAVGRGIAIPHPRNPIIADVDNESITVCSLSVPVNYNAIDGNPVHTMFIILSANARRHLEILSKLLYLCQQQPFIEMLSAGTPLKDVLEYVDQIEAKMKGPQK